MKEKLIQEIKSLIKSTPDESIEINPNYLNYFDEEELIDIRDKLQEKKDNIFDTTNLYVNEIYEKTKKDKL